MSADPFGTADLRAAVLGTWRSSPARLREDANTEEDHARGYYRDRVLVDLAQNASDAAVRAGVPGRLLFRLEADDDGPLLTVANTGAPLDAAGVGALASMRASAKRDSPGLVGRFGVGFAAVRAVADEIEVRSATGSVGFTLTGTRAALADAPADLAAEVARRGDWLPVLRLPFVSGAAPLPGYDTAVVARLRDAQAVDLVRAQLDAVGDPLLLALPGLVEIVVEAPDAPPRRIADVGSRWWVRTATGRLDPALTADRPVEERDRTTWQVTWALPRPDTGPLPAPVLHAPTPTDDPCTLPALLIATFPLDPTRRRVVPGRLTDAVLEHAARLYGELAAQVAVDGQLAADGQLGADEHVVADDPAADGPDVLALVPTGLPAGELDGQLAALVRAVLARTPLLPGPGGLVEPAAAWVLAGAAGADRPLVDALAARLPALVHVAPGRLAAARVLGVAVRPLADVVEELPAVAEGAARLYAACEGVLPEEGEALAGLPVPLADGRVVRGVRGTVLLAAPLVARLAPGTLAALADWGVRVVDPGAAHPVLERLGASAVDAHGLLVHPAVRAAVLDRQEDPQDEVGEVAATVLDLVRAVLDDDPDPRLPTWLGLVELPAADSEPTPAHGLVLPGSLAHRLFDDRVLAPVAASAVDRFGAQVLLAVGVRATPVVVHVPEVVADPLALDLDADTDAALVAATLDGWGEYLAELADRIGAGAWVGDLAAVADLDAVAEQSWPALLAELGADRRARDALVDEVRGERGTAPSYTTWWLRQRAGLGLDHPFALGPGVLDGLLPAAPPVLADADAQVRAALGGVRSPDELDLDAWARLLDVARGRPVEPATAVRVWRALAALAADGAPPAGAPVPAHLPALLGPGAGPGRVRVVEAESVVVPDSPMWLQRVDLGPMLPCPAARAGDLAALLDLPLAGDLADGLVEGAGVRQSLPGGLAEVLGTGGGADAPQEWVEHDTLRVDGAPVEWWVDADDVPHATHLAGLACALAQVTGRWADRWLLEAVLVDPARAGEAGLDRALA